MINVDGSIIIQIVNFIFLIFALNLVLYKPIRNILAQRKNKVTGLEQGVDTLLGNAQEKDEAFAAGIKAARAEGMKEKEALLEAAAEQEREIVGKINEKAQADLNAVRDRIAKDTDQVRTDLLAQVEEYATIIGQKILGRAVS